MNIYQVADNHNDTALMSDFCIIIAETDEKAKALHPIHQRQPCAWFLHQIEQKYEPSLSAWLIGKASDEWEPGVFPYQAFANADWQRYSPWA